MNLKFTTAIVSLCFLSVSCTTTDHLLLTQKELAPIPENECKVAVFTEKPKDKKFIEVAIISTTGDSVSDSSQLTRNVAEEACKLGPNAVVLHNFTTSNAIGSLTPGSTGNIQVLAIRLLK